MRNPPVRILYVEDHPMVAKIIQSLLETAGIEARGASSGEDGLALALREKFDLILLDVNLPGISGIEVCRRLRRDARLKAIPVVFLSAEAHPAYQAEAFKLGAVDYIIKPFEPGGFASRLLAHLGREP